jgi:hypothetical protein
MASPRAHGQLPSAAPPSSVMNSRRSFDHLIGAQQERLWNREAKRFGGRGVDD